MPMLSATALVRLVLLAVPLGASAPSPLPACERGTRRVELTADALRGEHEVCIHPGLSTSFLFDTKLARVELAGRERFRVIADEVGLTLVPTGAVADGERVPLTISFQDGTVPAGATFILVVHPSEAERQVEVTRRPRLPASHRRQAEQQARAEARRCWEEKARLEAECSGRVGLLGQLARGLLGEGGITGKNITGEVTAHPDNALQPVKILSYRSDTGHEEHGRKVVRLAVEQVLTNHGSTPWMPGGAVLVGPHGVEWKALGVWLPNPILPGMTRFVGVEVEMTEEEARGTFTLKLWSREGGGGSERFDGVTFP